MTPITGKRQLKVTRQGEASNHTVIIIFTGSENFSLTMLKLPSGEAGIHPKLKDTRLCKGMRTKGRKNATGANKQVSIHPSVPRIFMFCRV